MGIERWEHDAPDDPRAALERLPPRWGGWAGFRRPGVVLGGPGASGFCVTPTPTEPRCACRRLGVLVDAPGRALGGSIYRKTPDQPPQRPLCVMRALPEGNFFYTFPQLPLKTPCGLLDVQILAALAWLPRGVFLASDPRLFLQ